MIKFAMVFTAVWFAVLGGTITCAIVVNWYEISGLGKFLLSACAIFSLYWSAQVAKDTADLYKKTLP